MLRKVIRFLRVTALVAFSCLASLTIFVQTPLGRTAVTSYLQFVIKRDSGLEVRVDSTETQFPLYIELQNVQVIDPESAEHLFRADRIRCWWSPWQLFFDRLLIRNLEIEQARISESDLPVNLEARGWVSLTDPWHGELKQFSIHDAAWQLSGQLHSAGSHGARDARFTIRQLDKPLTPPSRGELHWSPKTGLTGHLRSGSWNIDDISGRGLEFAIEASPVDHRLEGELLIQGDIEGSPAKLTSPFTFSVTEGLVLPDIRGNWAELHQLAGNLHLGHSGVTGQVHANVSHPVKELQVSLELNASEDDGQAFAIGLTGLYEMDLHGRHQGPDLVIHRFDLNTRSFKGKLLSPFHLFVHGSQIALEPFDLLLNDGRLHAEVIQDVDLVNAAIHLENFPLEWIESLSPDAAIDGKAHGEIHISGSPQVPEVNFDLQLSDCSQLGRRGVRLPKLSGTVTGSMTASLLRLSSQLYTQDQESASFELNAPINFSLAPFNWQLDPSRNWEGQVHADGPLLPIVQIFVPDASRIVGHAVVDVAIGGRPGDLQMAGFARVRNGVYESLHLGSRFEDVQADFTLSGKDVYLDKVQGKAGREGSIRGHGQLSLDPNQELPYTVDATLKKVPMVKLDHVHATCSGSIQLTGNSKGVHLAGKARVVDGQIDIPDQMPVSVDSIEVTYINGPLARSNPVIPKKDRYPLTWDLTVSSTGNLRVQGRGLNSEWEGQVLITGSTDKLSLKGPLKVKQGDFSFSGRQFRIQEGQILFQGDPVKDTRLHLRANLDLNDLDVIAKLEGPLKSPVLRLESNPSMDQAEILSRVLFNKGVQHISGVQAITLANATAALSGKQNFDLIGKIRDSIGIDYLDIFEEDESASDDEENAADGRKLAIKVGKQLSRHLFVSVTRGVNSGNTKVGIEARLGSGLSVEASLDNETEGEVSLQWKRDY